MNLEDSKKAILEMAKKIEDDTLTYQHVAEFVLSFRTVLWGDQQAQNKNVPQGPYYAVSCSCASEVDSCVDCGPNQYTQFNVQDGQVISFNKVTKANQNER